VEIFEIVSLHHRLRIYKLLFVSSSGGGESREENEFSRCPSVCPNLYKAYKGTEYTIFGGGGNLIFKQSHLIDMNCHWMNEILS